MIGEKLQGSVLKEEAKSSCDHPFYVWKWECFMKETNQKSSSPQRRRNGGKRRGSKKKREKRIKHAHKTLETKQAQHGPQIKDAWLLGSLEDRGEQAQKCV